MGFKQSADFKTLSQQWIQRASCLNLASFFILLCVSLASLHMCSNIFLSLGVHLNWQCTNCSHKTAQLFLNTSWISTTDSAQHRRLHPFFSAAVKVVHTPLRTSSTAQGKDNWMHRSKKSLVVRVLSCPRKKGFHPHRKAFGS